MSEAAARPASATAALLASEAAVQPMSATVAQPAASAVAGTAPSEAWVTASPVRVRGLGQALAK